MYGPRILASAVRNARLTTTTSSMAVQPPTEVDPNPDEQRTQAVPNLDVAQPSVQAGPNPGVQRIQAVPCLDTEPLPSHDPNPTRASEGSISEAAPMDQDDDHDMESVVAGHLGHSPAHHARSHGSPLVEASSDQECDAADVPTDADRGASREGSDHGAALLA